MREGAPFFHAVSRPAAVRLFPGKAARRLGGRGGRAAARPAPAGVRSAGAGRFSAPRSVFPPKTGAFRQNRPVRPPILSGAGGPAGTHFRGRARADAAGGGSSAPSFFTQRFDIFSYFSIAVKDLRNTEFLSKNLPSTSVKLNTFPKLYINFEKFLRNCCTFACNIFFTSPYICEIIH